MGNLFDNFIAVIIGILSSVASSFVYLWAISYVKPRMKISHQIAHSPSTKGTLSYTIKVINLSRRPLINIDARLYLVRTVNVEGGTVDRTTEVKLVQNSPMVIKGYKSSDKEAGYAYRFRTKEDISTLWTDAATTYAKFRIIGVDSLSNFAAFFEQEYRNKQADVVDGVFEHGKSLRITQTLQSRGTQSDIVDDIGENQDLLP